MSVGVVSRSPRTREACTPLTAYALPTSSSPEHHALRENAHFYSTFRCRPQFRLGRCQQPVATIRLMTGHYWSVGNPISAATIRSPGTLYMARHAQARYAHLRSSPVSATLGSAGDTRHFVDVQESPAFALERAGLLMRRGSITCFGCRDGHKGVHLSRYSVAPTTW